jgi:hypothetical protein
MELPITEKELDYIIEMLKHKGQTTLYAKLWTFKINKVKREEK